MKDPDCQIVAVCEEDAAARSAARADITVNYDSITKMLAEVPCDAVAIGDYYGKRGAIAIEALKAGKHVISDKPLCTSLDELARIEAIAKEKGLKVGCMLDVRTAPPIAAARKAILSGMIGDIVHIQFGGQHPLLPGSRPGWYFEPGKHGGTITDIASHATDIIPWITGLKIDKVIAARTWQAMEKESECFKDAAQIMITLENGCGVMGDVSYAEPDSHGYKMPHYWRFTVWGTKGVLEFNCIQNNMTAWINGEAEPRQFTAEPYTGPRYLDWFLMVLHFPKIDCHAVPDFFLFPNHFFFASHTVFSCVSYSFFLLPFPEKPCCPTQTIHALSYAILPPCPAEFLQFHSTWLSLRRSFLYPLDICL